jgi:uncharacterized protein YkwD
MQITLSCRLEDTRRAFLQCMLCISGLAVLSACAGPPRRDITATTSDEPQALAAINAYRAQAGLQPVRLDPALRAAALRQAVAMGEAGLLSHEIAGALRQRLDAVGVRDVIAAENISRGTPDVTRAILSWRGSPPHDRNLRLADATRIGLARADGAGGPWWALVLAGDQREGARWSL